jgi:[ribosomal protein S5]-alanine N-acetyltransferase
MPFQLPAVVESDELLLREPAADDAPALFDAMLGDAETTRCLAFTRHRHVGETLAYIETARRAAEAGTRRCWILVDKASGALVGMIDMGIALPRVEVGAMISKRGGTRRRRASLQALRKLIDWTLGQPGVFRVYATCAANGDARSAMERLGFVREALLVNHEAQPNLGLAATDHILFARTRPCVAQGAASSAQAQAARWLDAVFGDDLAQTIETAIRAKSAAPATAPTAERVVALDDICGFDDEGMPIFRPVGEAVA